MIALDARRNLIIKAWVENNKENLELWIKNLESGNYRQQINSLHTPQTNSYCVLGVYADAVMGSSWSAMGRGDFGGYTLLPESAMPKELQCAVSNLNDAGLDFCSIAWNLKGLITGDIA